MRSHDRDAGPSPDGSTPPESQALGSVELERLPQGRRGPAAFALVVVSIIVVLVWAPWREDPRSRSAASAQTDRQSPEATFAKTAPTPSPAPNSSAPAASSTAPVIAGRARYESITDNEWTVVALLTPFDGGSSTEEPANQHENWPATTSDGPFVVLQQGVLAARQPVERPDRPATACATSGSRDQAAVHLPQARVVYLGVTFPGMDPQAKVAVSALTSSAQRLTKPRSVAVELAGMRAGWQYTVPTTGPGGTILFTTSPAGPLASGPYRFEIRTPASDSARFVYACIGL
jgi:hypothetical protein